jgi:hypothetical protein
MDGASDKAIALHLPESLSEHLLADISEQLGQPREAQDTVFRDHLKDKHGPFVGNPAYDLLDNSVKFRTRGAALGRRIANGFRNFSGLSRGNYFVSHPVVSTALLGAYFQQESIRFILS